MLESLRAALSDPNPPSVAQLWKLAQEAQLVGDDEEAPANVPKTMIVRFLETKVSAADDQAAAAAARAALDETRQAAEEAQRAAAAAEAEAQAARDAQAEAEAAAARAARAEAEAELQAAREALRRAEAELAATRPAPPPALRAPSSVPPAAADQGAGITIGPASGAPRSPGDPGIVVGPASTAPRRPGDPGIVVGPGGGAPTPPPQAGPPRGRVVPLDGMRQGVLPPARAGGTRHVLTPAPAPRQAVISERPEPPPAIVLQPDRSRPAVTARPLRPAVPGAPSPSRIVTRDGVIVIDPADVQVETDAPRGTGLQLDLDPAAIEAILETLPDGIRVLARAALDQARATAGEAR